MLSQFTKFLPAIAAAAYLVYILASGQTDQTGQAITQLLIALGVSHQVGRAHGRLDEFIYGG